MAAENTDIDDIIDRLRTAHAAGAGLDEINMRLGSLIALMAPVPLSSPEPHTEIQKPERNQQRRPEPNPPQQQSPLTRSKPSQPSENTQKSANQRTDSRVWATQVGHNRSPDYDLTPYNREENDAPEWGTRLGHKASVRGLWRRGNVYQFRIRVPVNLRGMLGCSHIKRSLRTDSLKLAIRLSRKLASDVDGMFEQARRFSCPWLGGRTP